MDALGQAGLQKDPWVSSQRAEKAGHGHPPTPTLGEVFLLESQQLRLEASSQEERAERLFQELGGGLQAGEGERGS